MKNLQDMQQTTFKVGQFLNWQRSGELELSPSFQRRPVWKPAAKSYLIDTVVRGLPVPVVFLRERLRLDTLDNIYEVVDGQQRLRTLFSFIDETSLNDFNAERDRFVVRASHNSDIANAAFASLHDDVKRRILGYRFSVHILPSEVSDPEVLQIFARMNSTGVKASGQELRNARFLGPFKQSMYRLAYEQLQRWRKWRVFTEFNIARMKEVEFVSDATNNIISGLSGKTQSKLDKLYDKYDDSFPLQDLVERRFRAVMDAIDDSIGTSIARSAYSSEVNFFTLFVYIYDRLFGLGEFLENAKPRSLPKHLDKSLMKASSNIKSESVPNDFADAFGRASTDKGRRQTRLAFMHEACD